MSLYDGIECPVCHRKFADGDDVVICPECGTPHHRECYNTVGHCVNENLHESGFVFDREKELQKSIENKPTEKNESAFSQNPTAYNVNNEYYTNENTEKNSQNNSENANQNPFTPADMINRDVRTLKYKNDIRKVDGESAYEAATVVGTNVDRFMNKFFKFQSGKKLSWNWGAFFFGPYYFFWRKMYKPGALFVSIQLICRILITAVFYDQYYDFLNLISNATTQNAQQIANSSEFQAFMPVSFVVLGTMLVINIICAMFADYLYKGKVVEVIRKAHNKIDESLGAFSNSPMMFGNDSVNFNSNDYLLLMLSSSGSTSIFAPVAAYFVLDMVVTLISSIVTMF